MSDYITSDEFKETLSLVGNSYADADIAAAIAAASRAIDGYTGRRFWLDADAAQVRYYSTSGRERSLEIDDAVEVAAVALDDALDGTFASSLAATTEYVLAPLNAAADGRPFEEIRLRPGVRFPCGEQTVRVTGRFGWPQTPSVVVEATTILASRLLARKREAPFGIVTAGADTAAVLRISRTDPDVALLLDNGNLVRGVFAD